MEPASVGAPEHKIIFGDLLPANRCQHTNPHRRVNCGEKDRMECVDCGASMGFVPKA